jgi:hypothetical protein
MSNSVEREKQDDNTLDLTYNIAQNPPWGLSIFLGLQVSNLVCLKIGLLRQLCSACALHTAHTAVQKLSVGHVVAIDSDTVCQHNNHRIRFWEKRQKDFVFWTHWVKNMRYRKDYPLNHSIIEGIINTKVQNAYFQGFPSKPYYLTLWYVMICRAKLLFNQPACSMTVQASRSL